MLITRDTGGSCLLLLLLLLLDPVAGRFPHEEAERDPADPEVLSDPGSRVVSPSPCASCYFTCTLAVRMHVHARRLERPLTALFN
ncbi:hypothetical protein EYF80_040480 [Liparis tanakae]|uniref:Uncharacterized protein n=1 Tax=Liparis tanakae TaxID=230148 RepID=A0A4Z2G8A6_9TELE|nr:hypothetical protein EYF80_040480 [Liparis tanakae]